MTFQQVLQAILANTISSVEPGALSLYRFNKGPWLFVGESSLSYYVNREMSFPAYVTTDKDEADSLHQVLLLKTMESHLILKTCQ